MLNSKTKVLIISIMLAGAGLAASAGSYSGPHDSDRQPEVVVSENSTENEILLENDLAPKEKKGYSSMNDTVMTEFGNTAVIQKSEMSREMIAAEKNRQVKENDSWGGAVTIISMCIVIAALAVLSILFLCFGKISEAVMTKKKKAAKKAAAHDFDETHHELAPGEVIAAIAMALSEHFQGGHDIEDTILTIQRMKKAYSPWNSKIYNLRNIPDHNRGPVDRSAFAKR